MGSVLAVLDPEEVSRADAGFGAASVFAGDESKEATGLAGLGAAGIPIFAEASGDTGLAVLFV